MNSTLSIAIEQCRANPAYFVRAFGLDIPCPCYPLMENDTYGWQTVKRGGRKARRVKKVKTDQQLEAEADMGNWEDVDHVGKATYAYNDSTPAFEHNGALFDIGSRF